MRITKDALNKINNSITDSPPETGGIIGSSNGELIDKVVMDINDLTTERLCSYYPNVDFLNFNIQVWQENGIYFTGVFHTHFVGVKTLSYADKKYICAIMSVMPEDINILYFPLFVLPDRELVCYKAERKNNITEIYQDELIIEN